MCSHMEVSQTILEQLWYNTGTSVTRLVRALNKALSILGKENRESFTKQLSSCST